MYTLPSKLQLKTKTSKLVFEEINGEIRIVQYILVLSMNCGGGGWWCVAIKTLCKLLIQGLSRAKNASI